jgi:DNA-binding MarR family transcriptional regulator
MKTKRKIIREIVTISRCISFIRQEEFKKYDLTRGQHAFLTRIMENPGISQEELSYMLRMDKTTTAKALKRLEEKGYINKIKSSKDKRSWNVYPTDKLIEIYPAMFDRIENTSKIGLQGFTEGELELIVDFMERIRINIDAEWKKMKNTEN